jgi:hypothetical protein
MRTLHFILFALFAFVSVGCENNDDLDSGGTTPYFITHYMLVDGLDCRPVYKQTSSSGYAEISDMPTVYLVFNGRSVHGGGSSPSQEYIFFQEMYGDKCFNGVTVPNSVGAIAYPIEKITLVSNNNFDAEHPAGSVVDDVVRLNLATYETFIKNGYTYPEEWDYLRYSSEYLPGLIPVGEFYLSEVTGEIARLISCSPFGSPLLKFMQEPEVAGEYPFTLTITMNGEEISKTFKVTFGETTAEE